MARGKSVFTFTFEDPMVANNLMQQFLMQNNFKAINYKGTTVYQMGNGLITAKKFIEYTIQGNTLTIYAYVYKIKKPVLLDDAYYCSIPKNELKTVLFPFLNYLDQFTQGNTQNNIPNNMQGNIQNNMTNNMQANMYNNMPNNQNINNYKPNNKTYNIFAIVGFILSLLGLLLSLVGASIGIIGIAMFVFFAVYGLKSDHKGLAIATIIFIVLQSIISFIYFLIGLSSVLG